MSEILLALDRQPLAIWLRASLAYPVLETIHLFGLATLFGSLLVVDLRLLGWGRQLDPVTLARRVLPLTLCGFAVAAVSGGAMLFARAADLAGNPYFQAKVLILAVAGSNALLLHSRGTLDERSLLTRVQATISIIAWLSIIACGRWIAYH